MVFERNKANIEAAKRVLIGHNKRVCETNINEVFFLLDRMSIGEQIEAEKVFGFNGKTPMTAAEYDRYCNSFRDITFSDLFQMSFKFNFWQHYI